MRRGSYADFVYADHEQSDADRTDRFARGARAAAAAARAQKALSGAGGLSGLGAARAAAARSGAADAAGSAGAGHAAHKLCDAGRPDAVRAGRSAGRADAGPMGNGRTGGRAQPCKHKPDDNLQPDRSPARSVARRRRHFRHPAGCQLRNTEKAAGPHGRTGETRRPARRSGLSAQRSRYFPENSASDLPCRRLPDARGLYPPGALSAGREHLGRRCRLHLPPRADALPSRRPVAQAAADSGAVRTLVQPARISDRALRAGGY